jgi:N-acetylmuramoyl-L-alanine amidase
MIGAGWIVVALAAGTVVPAQAGAPLLPPPAVVVVATPRGEVRLELLEVSGGALLAAEPLVAALGGQLDAADPVWADVRVGGTLFRFMAGVPVAIVGDRVEGIGVGALRVRDSLYLPLPFVTHLLPRAFPARYRWEAAGGRLVEAAAVAASPRAGRRLARTHLITVDPGHGGEDPGNPCSRCAGGLTESDVTLKVGLLLRDELESRGVRVRMTRADDTRPTFRARAATCSAECDLFVSLHVDALAPRGRRQNAALRGFSAYIIGEENTEDARRVARMENEAMRYDSVETVSGNALDFILRDLQMNEYLRESAQAATLLHEEVARVHPGANRGVRKFTNIAVLNLARRPAMLVEMGFGDHPGDAKFLSDPRSQRRLAAAMATAIESYLVEYELRTGTSPGATP